MLKSKRAIALNIKVKINFVINMQENSVFYDLINSDYQYHIRRMYEKDKY